MRELRKGCQTIRVQASMGGTGNEGLGYNIRGLGGNLSWEEGGVGNLPTPSPKGKRASGERCGKKGHPPGSGRGTGYLKPTQVRIP